MADYVNCDWLFIRNEELSGRPERCYSEHTAQITHGVLTDTIIHAVSLRERPPSVSWGLCGYGWPELPGLLALPGFVKALTRSMLAFTEIFAPDGTTAIP